MVPYKCHILTQNDNASPNQNKSINVLRYHFCVVYSGGARTVKEPGHFEVRNPLARSPGCTFFLKKVDDHF